MGERAERLLALDLRGGGVVLGLLEALAQHARALDEILQPGNVVGGPRVGAMGDAAGGLVLAAAASAAATRAASRWSAMRRSTSSRVSDGASTSRTTIRIPARRALGSGWWPSRTTPSIASRARPWRIRSASGCHVPASREPSSLSSDVNSQPSASGTATTTKRSERTAPPGVWARNVSAARSAPSASSSCSKDVRTASSAPGTSTSTVGRPTSRSAGAPSRPTTPTPHSATAPSGVLRT